MTEARTGAEARDTTDSAYNIPYRTSYQYDAFGHQSYMSYRHFAQGPVNTTTTYQNNRISGKGYDADGRMVEDAAISKSYGFDAAGRLGDTDYQYCDTQDCRYQQETLAYSGDGFLDKVETSSRVNDDPPDEETTYRVRSSVMGGAAVYENGKVFVIAAGMQIATHYYGISDLKWNHKDLNEKGYRSTDANGAISGSGTSGVDWDMIETDADGKNVGFSDPGLGFPPPGGDLFNSETSFSSVRGGEFTNYTLDGLSIPFDTFLMETGRLGRSLNVACSQLGEVYINPYAPWDSRRLTINQNCEDRITLARHGIFINQVPGSERIPDTVDYTLADASQAGPPPPPGPCDVEYPLIPFRGREWAGLVRKAGTASEHQFGTAKTAHFIRELGDEWPIRTLRLFELVYISKVWRRHAGSRRT